MFFTDLSFERRELNLNAYRFVRVSRKARLTGASVIARDIVAHGIVAARARYQALVHILATDLAVAEVARLAFAQEVGRKVATLGVLHASRGECRVIALVDVCRPTERNIKASGIQECTCRPRERERKNNTRTFAVETVPLVAGETGTLEATKSVGAMREYITGPVFALVLV